MAVSILKEAELALKRVYCQNTRATTENYGYSTQSLTGPS